MLLCKQMDAIHKPGSAPRSRSAPDSRDPSLGSQIRSEHESGNQRDEKACSWVCFLRIALEPGIGLTRLSACPSKLKAADKGPWVRAGDDTILKLVTASRADVDVQNSTECISSSCRQANQSLDTFITDQRPRLGGLQVRKLPYISCLMCRADKLRRLRSSPVCLGFRFSGFGWISGDQSVPFESEQVWLGQNGSDQLKLLSSC
jgi:hypothetical protein